MKKVKIGRLLIRVKEPVLIEDGEDYKRVTIRLNHKGVYLRDIEKGFKIGTKRQFLVKSGQFILSRIDARNGAFGIVPEELNNAVVGNDFWVFNINEALVDRDFFYFYSSTNDFLDKCIQASKGTTNRKRLDESSFLNFEVDLPDLSYQRAIIEKFKIFQQNHELLRTEYINQEQLISKLRQSILQDAVQGKLVPQDPADEPAAELLKRIKAEKLRLMREKKIKEEKPLPPISPDEVPYELPEGWVWVRFPEIGELARGKSKNRPRNDPTLFINGKYPFVQTGDVARSNGKITTYSQMYNDLGLKQSRMWKKGTLCITIAANIAETGILQFDACFPDSIVGFIPSPLIGSPEYFEYFLRVAKSQLIEYAPSTAQKNINLGILQEVLIPLPPINELKRIVTKVDELMRLCDELEEQIRQSKEESERLMQAVLREAFEGKDVEESNAEMSVA